MAATRNKVSLGQGATFSVKNRDTFPSKPALLFSPAKQGQKEIISCLLFKHTWEMIAAFFLSPVFFFLAPYRRILI